MAISKKVKNLKGRPNDSYIVEQYIMPYTLESKSRYKHIDNLLLQSEKEIKATLGPVDMSVFPFSGIKTHTVSAAEENRIDIIATKYYGSASLYWVICYLNNIADPLVLPVNRVLLIPSLEALRQFPNPLS